MEQRSNESCGHVIYTEIQIFGSTHARKKLAMKYLWDIWSHNLVKEIFFPKEIVFWPTFTDGEKLCSLDNQISKENDHFLEIVLLKLKT